MDKNKDNKYLVAADTGGTFTDLVVYNCTTCETMFSKTLTTYDDLVAGVLGGLSELDMTTSNITMMKHGTTQVINAFVQRQGGKVALITTAGFRDILEIARGNRPVPFDLRFSRSPSLVPRDLCFEVEERIDSQGRVLQPMDVGSMRVIAAEIAKTHVDAVAVSFINSYRNPEHENAAAAILRELLPGVFITTGIELTGEWSEYERTSTAAANAYVGEQMSTYIDSFMRRLGAEGFNGSLFMMGSNGGAITIPHSLRQPVALLESGPVGGCIGAGVYAQLLGYDKAIAFDMGGTTAKCALLEAGKFEVHSTYYVGGYERGFPVRTPVIDIVEVGAGGGSIGWLDPGGSLRLGPHSAGSSPGPICFGGGGCEPTLTDANVVLGRIGADSFMDGKLKLDVAAARTGIRRSLAVPLAFDSEAGVDRVASGLLDIAVITMTGAIKEITIERGKDVRDFALIVFGGGGPLFASQLAREMGIRTVVVPPHPGAFSSLGMLLADARFDVARTHVGPVEDNSLSEVAGILRELEVEATNTVSRDLDMESVRFEHDAELRYSGQKHTVRIRLPNKLSAVEIRSGFEAAYAERYGRSHPASSVELIMLRVAAFLPMSKPELSSLAVANAESEPTAFNRSVYFSSLGERVDTPVYRRHSLPRGFRVSGPAIVEEYSSTTIVGPHDELVVGEYGELQIDCTAAGDV